MIFSSLSFSEYEVFGVSSDFLAGGGYKVDLVGKYSYNSHVRDKLSQLQNSTSFIRLENEACIAAYTTSLVSEWGNVLLVSNLTGTNNSFLNSWAGLGKTLPGPGGSIFCVATQQCTGPKPVSENWLLENRVSNTEAFSNPVDHCMATRAQQHCKMRFSMSLMIAIIACNVIKVVCMAVIFWRMDPYPLVTIGDAIASFLNSPGRHSPPSITENIQVVPNCPVETFDTLGLLPYRYCLWC